MIRTRNSETIQPILLNTELVRARLESSTSKKFGPDRTIIVGVIVPSDGRTDRQTDGRTERPITIALLSDENALKRIAKPKNVHSPRLGNHLSVDMQVRRCDILRVRV